MAASKGTRPPNAGKGRKKGVPNKITAAVKDMVIQALEGAGGVAYLQQQATENPTAFLTLVGKVIPTQMQHEGSDGGVIRVRVVHQFASESDAV